MGRRSFQIASTSVYDRSFSSAWERGVSLLETVFALILIAAVAPFFFGIFFSNVSLANATSAKVELKSVINDTKSFIRLSPYEKIRSLVKRGITLKVKEVDERGVMCRTFVVPNVDEEPSFGETFVKFSSPNSSDMLTERDIEDEECCFLLKCQILKGPKASGNFQADGGKIAEEDSFLFVKNR